MLVLNHQQRSGSGLFNNLLNSLPVEVHLPGNNYLGPGINLAKCLSRGDKGINPVDEAAKQHYIFYSQHKGTTSLHIADKELENKAWNRVLAKDSSLGEKAASYLTTNLIKAKRHLGMGLNDKDARRKNRNCCCSLKKKIGGSMTLPMLVHHKKTAPWQGNFV